MVGLPKFYRGKKGVTYGDLGKLRHDAAEPRAVSRREDEPESG